MNKNYVIPVIILFVGAIVLFSVLKGRSIVTTRVVLSGADGLRVMGAYTADGKEYKVDEILPAEITVSAKRVSLLVESSEESETIFGKVFLNDKLSVSGSQRHLKIKVLGNTMFSSTPRAHLAAF